RYTPRPRPLPIMRRDRLRRKGRAVARAFAHSELTGKHDHVVAITAAEKVLIAGGVLNLAYGVLLGYPIVVIRVKGARLLPRSSFWRRTSARCCRPQCCSA